MKDSIAHNIQQLHGQIAGACEEYDRDADDITIVAVTKTHPTVVIQTVVAAGIHEIGESRVQDAEPKIKEAGPIARYHMVGHLQTNKVRKALGLFDVIQSVDTLKLAEEINRQAGILERRVECLIEVNCSGESQKFGVNPEDSLALISQVAALSNIDLIGLMTIGPFVDDDKVIRRTFARCNELFMSGRESVGDQFDTLSMGMSGDFTLAIAEGATMIRIGSSLFGPRP
ncbi:MAG: YggS family pyridoxal phosphate-dependent enzyme [candidate division Zixibacteria bacterium]|nr:YggS family pyridoxal phosphate-dependent enzyme [candidate division Zixibacteria bacterium]MDH3937850.1 YggS family pyridoxal phosphate-dependent enzyme [candidate division Zixibacteria bacterium]MDH4032309.1 YggS family pyridoxal phosphate-dependent enzyme [candidate division Zixibacteria bacterium]